MSLKTHVPVLCSNCKTPLPPGTTWRTVLCEECKKKHIAAWREEHTRQGPTDTRTRWLIGDECTIKLGKVTYDAEILDMSDVSRSESNHDLVKLKLSKTVTGLDGKPYTQTWTHPEPVQSYKLRKPLLK